MKYTEQWKTRWHDTDAVGRVTPSHLLVYMQETSNGHTASTGLPLDELRRQRGLAFILSRLRLRIHAPLHAFEEVTVNTWTTPSRGFASNRSFEILREGEMIAECDSSWALVGIEDHSLHKPEEAAYDFVHGEPSPMDLPPRIRFPADAPLEEIGTRRIVYSDLDYNGHMNNTRYPNMLLDFLPREEALRARGFVLSFLHEAAEGDVIRVLCAKEGENRYFRTVNEAGTVCLEALVVLE